MDALSQVIGQFGKDILLVVRQASRRTRESGRSTCPKVGQIERFIGAANLSDWIVFQVVESDVVQSAGGDERALSEVAVVQNL